MSNLLNASEQGKRPQVAKLSEIHTAGSGFFVCEALAGWANECSFVVYEVDTEGNPISDSETDWIGVKNNKTLQNLELTAGIDRDYPTDRTYIVATETAGGRNKLIEGLKNTLDGNGDLKSHIVGENNLKNLAVTGPKIAPGAINNDKITNNSIDGKKITDGSIQLSKIEDLWKGNTYSVVKKAIGVWHDGRTIYRKVVTGSELSTLNLGESFEAIVSAKLMSKTRQNEWRPIPWTFGINSAVSGSWTAGFYISSNGDIIFQGGTDITTNVNYIHAIIDFIQGA